jgi:hypothetical protein
MAETKTKVSAGNGETKGREPRTRSEAGTREQVTRQVKIKGIGLSEEMGVMFDRYAGDNETKLEPWQKMYLGGEDGKTICLPSENLMSFLSAQNTDSAPKRLLDSRKYKNFALACGSYVSIAPLMIPFLRGGKPIKFGKFVNERDPESGVYIARHVARLEKGIPNPKVRPVLPLPWELEFKLTILPNNVLQEQQLINVVTQGLLGLGIGTFRGRYGKAVVVSWE